MRATSRIRLPRVQNCRQCRTGDISPASRGDRSTSHIMLRGPASTRCHSRTRSFGTALGMRAARRWAPSGAWADNRTGTEHMIIMVDSDWPGKPSGWAPFLHLHHLYIMRFRRALVPSDGGPLLWGGLAALERRPQAWLHACGAPTIFVAALNKAGRTTGRNRRLASVRLPGPFELHHYVRSF